MRLRVETGRVTLVQKERNKTYKQRLWCSNKVISNRSLEERAESRSKDFGTGSQNILKMPGVNLIGKTEK